jgi:hypothetical protein
MVPGAQSEGLSFEAFVRSRRAASAALWVLASAALVFAGCSEPTSPSQQVPESPDVSDVSLPQGVSELEFAALMAEGNDFVRSVLDDGRVLPSEYEAAVLQVLQCLDEDGVPYTEPELEDTQDGPRWTYGVGPSTDQEAAEHGRIHDECDAEYLRPVLSIWVRQEQPSESEIEQGEAQLVQCLQDAGISVSSSADAILLRREGALSAQEQVAYVQCITQTN